MKTLLYTATLLLAALVALALSWAAGNYTAGPTPDLVSDDPRLSFRRAAHLARSAVRRYRELPPYERRALTDDLRNSLDHLDGWSRHAQNSAGFICLGERHEDAMRAFIGRQVLTHLSFDVLMLETGEARLHQMLTEFAQGRSVDLLGAQVTPILDAARSRRPRPVLAAIDEKSPRGPGAPGSQTMAGLDRREDRLVAALRGRWQPRRRHVVLFGALHCRDVPGWMLHRVSREDGRVAAAGVHGAVLLARYQEPAAQVLFYLLEEIGIAHRILTIPDIARFPRQIQLWIPPLADALAGYHGAILFDEKALGLASPRAGGEEHD